MIITFLGHSSFRGSKEYEQRIIDFLEEKIDDQPAEIYLGGYGGFDDFAYECCKIFKEKHPSVSLIFVTPYLTVEYQKNHLNYQKTRYDAILYPDIEDKPPRFAIIYRNRFMVERADYIISYVNHDWGGAYTAYKYAKKIGKRILNLGIIK